MIQQTFAAAAAYDYVTAHQRASALDRLLASPSDESALARGVLALDLVDRAGIRRSARGRSALLTRAIDPLRGVYRGSSNEVCRAALVQPVEGPSDLGLLGPNARALDPFESGKPSLAVWLRAYEKAVTFADEGKLAWALMPELLHDRGEAPGRDPRLTRTYMRVTALALGHIKAARALALEAPPDHRAVSVLGLASEPGAVRDEAIARALIDLAEVTASAPVGRAASEDAALDALLTTALHGASLPPLVSGPYFKALESSLAAKLRSDLADRTGFSAAALHVAGVALRALIGVDVGFDRAAAAIVKALAKTSAHPELAALASAITRLAALTQTGDLTPRSVGAQTPKRDLREARDALSRALAGLADQKPPRNVVDDLTALTVGVIALAAPGKEAPKVAKAPSAKACEPPPKEPDVYARRALDRLGDVRRRLLSYPTMRSGEGAFIEAARLLVVVLSDAMDHLAKSAIPTIPWSEAKPMMERGLMRPAPDKAPLATALYGLLRGLLLKPPKGDFLAEHQKDLSTAAPLLASLFGGDHPLSRVLAAMGQGGSKDGARALVAAAARALFDANARDEAELALSAAILVSTVTHAPPAEAAVSLAAAMQSDVTWPLVVAKARFGSSGAPDVAALDRAAQAITGESTCEGLRAEAFVEASRGLHLASTGKLSEGRALLEQALTRAERAGLTVPKRVVRYVGETAALTFSLEMGASFGGLLLSGADSYGVGIGPRGFGPSPGVSRGWAPFDSPAERDEAARAYVQIAALTSVLHFLSGDDLRAIHAAGLALSALSGALRLGPRILVATEPEAWARDARGAMILAAQLAAEQGHTFLAGDLWAAIHKGGAAEAELLSSIEPLPPLLAPFPALAPVAKRAQLPIRVLAHKPPCDDRGAKKKRGKRKKQAPLFGMFEEPACALYPQAIALRIADKLPWLPRLHRAFGAAADCPLSRRSLDTFLGAADRGRYDPDAFLTAVTEAAQEGLIYDAAALLTRHAKRGHCAPRVVAAARALGASADLPPSMRADLLTMVVNCQSASSGPSLPEDARALDEVTKRLPDPTRNLTLSLSMGDLAVTQGRWALLGAITASPDYLSRWLGVHPDATLSALVLHHASLAARGLPIDRAATEEAYLSACELLPANERKARCAEVRALRDGKAEKREALAKKMVEGLLADAAVKTVK